MDETYGNAKKAVSRQKDEKSEKANEPAKTGLSFLEMERRKAKEDKQLLDKLTGKENKENSESASEVFAKSRQNTTNTDFQEKLRKAGEKAEEDKPANLPRPPKAKGTPLRQEDRKQLAAVYDAWDNISQRQGRGTTKIEK